MAAGTWLKAEVVTNVITHSTAISAGVRTSQWQQALRFLLAMMLKAEVETSVITNRAAIGAA
jgi:hypothetical protein